MLRYGVLSSVMLFFIVGFICPSGVRRSSLYAGSIPEIMSSFPSMNLRYSFLLLSMNVILMPSMLGSFFPCGVFSK